MESKGMSNNAFTYSIAMQIKKLLDERLSADRIRKKSIRAKLRGLGFYISDYFNGFSSHDFDKLVETGKITVIGQCGAGQVPPIPPPQLPKVGGEAKSVDTKQDHETNDGNKLFPLAKMIAGLLEEKFGIAANYKFEVIKNWLPNTPTRSQFEERWKDIETVYYQLVDRKWTLESRLKEFKDDLNANFQKIDVWYAEPYQFIFEFDECQHFNQFRLATLEHYPYYSKHSFDFEQYRVLSTQKVVNPSTFGFQKLRSFDPLFPEMYDGEKQDNRVRQRAFRDFMKDITPNSVGLNPTIRLSYKTTNGKNGKKVGFNSSDVEAARQLIQSKGWLDRIVIKD